VKTRKIAEILKKNLARLGIEMIAKETRMDASWEKALRSDDYDLFLMGFKADYAGTEETFLEPLFSSSGYANFMKYRNKEVDQLLGELKQTGSAARAGLLKTLNNLIYQDLPVIPIFYIEKI
jgi:ABC-type oligopeptide transport system substrate-binding subunit